MGMIPETGRWVLFLIAIQTNLHTNMCRIGQEQRSYNYENPLLVIHKASVQYF